jgi:biopolymer transport protein ExbD
MFQSVRLRRKGHRQVEIRIAPLIDMVFILLIFFIVTTTFVSETGLDVERPQSQASRELPEDAILIGLGPSGEIYLDGNRISLFSLRSRISNSLIKNPQRAVVVVADQAASAQMIVRAMDELRLGGATRIALATRNNRKL